MFLIIAFDGCSAPALAASGACGAGHGATLVGLNADLAVNVVLVKLIPLSPPRAPMHRQTQIS